VAEREKNKKTNKSPSNAVKPYKNKNFIHGFGDKKSRTYSAWLLMRYRCLSKDAPSYHKYGGRGIRICKEWDSFLTFLKDMGEAPAGHTLQRVNDDKDFCKQNCRWTKTNHGETWETRRPSKPSKRNRKQLHIESATANISKALEVLHEVRRLQISSSWLQGFFRSSNRFVNVERSLAEIHVLLASAQEEIKKHTERK